ncbi:NADH-quinone oxidoreductase subunit H [Candidatus Bipolaricaulota bacterium]|nr:NADH-quinone oxidoreductase subunit H [Candidatus Bipolaricaulota bacterium]
MVMTICGFIFSPLIAIIMGLLMLGVTRKVMARIHWRYGPPLLQPVIDIIKLFYQKAPSHGSLFDFGVILSLTGSIVVLLFLPIGRLAPLSPAGGLLAITYLMLVAPLGIALSGGEGANPNISIGISRKLILSFGYEVSLVLGILAVMTRYGTISIVKVVEVQQTGGWSLFSWPLVVAGIAYLLILPAILGVRPFDVVSAPQEISSGPNVEYGGKYLGLSTISHALSEFISIGLFVNLFLGGWGLWGAISPFQEGGLGVFLGVMIFLAKIFLVYMAGLLISAVLPRLRVDQAVRYLLKWPSFLAFVGLVLAWAL